MIIRKSINLLDIIIDEVSLEGLDGITLDGMYSA
jgi:hypothetical protein